MENFKSNDSNIVNKHQIESDSLLNKRRRIDGPIICHGPSLEKRLKIDFIAPLPKVKIIPGSSPVRPSTLMSYSNVSNDPVKSDLNITTQTQELINGTIQKQSLPMKVIENFPSLTPIMQQAITTDNQSKPTNNRVINPQVHQNINAISASINSMNYNPDVNYNEAQWDLDNFNFKKKNKQVKDIFNQLIREISSFYQSILYLYQNITINPLTEENLKFYNNNLTYLSKFSSVIKNKMQFILDSISEYSKNTNSFDVILNAWQESQQSLSYFIEKTNKKVQENMYSMILKLKKTNKFHKDFLINQITDIEKEMNCFTLFCQNSAIENKKSPTKINFDLLYKNEKNILETKFIEINKSLNHWKKEKQIKKSFLLSLSSLFSNNSKNLVFFNKKIKEFMMLYLKNKENLKAFIQNNTPNNYMIWHYPIALTEHQIKEEEINNAALLIEKDLEARRGPNSFYGYTLEKNYNYSTQRFIKGYDNDNIFQDVSFYMAPILIKKEQGFNSNFSGIQENFFTFI
jgi:hypothetical protein